jgi:hypothetical protein
MALRTDRAQRQRQIIGKRWRKKRINTEKVKKKKNKDEDG